MLTTKTGKTKKIAWSVFKKGRAFEHFIPLFKSPPAVFEFEYFWENTIQK